MKILVSGADGFIGKNIIKKLKNEGHLVYAIVRPSTDLTFLKEEKINIFTHSANTNKLLSFIKKNNFDGVIHLASLFLAKHKPDDIRELINSNILFSVTLLEASAQNKIPWFINTGTFWQHYENKKYSPVNLYAATKQAFEVLAQYYIETFNINFVTIKLSDTFGPNDTRIKIFNLWSKISKNKETIDMSPGEQIIDINYIDNVVDGYIKMINLLSKDKKNKLAGKTFAIKSNQRMSLKKLATIFEDTNKVTLNINWGKREYRPREVMIPWEKGINIPGWKPKISIEEGIKKTFNLKK